MSLFRREEEKRGESKLLSDWWSRVSRIAVCWPGEGIDVQAAYVVLERIRERFPSAHISIIALPGVGASAPHYWDVEVINVQKVHLNYLGFPNKQFRQFLKERGYDTFVDLSPYDDPISAYYAALIDADIRIGFGGGWSERVLNFVVIPKGDKKGIERYRVLARYIG